MPEDLFAKYGGRAASRTEQDVFARYGGRADPLAEPTAKPWDKFDSGEYDDPAPAPPPAPAGPPEIPPLSQFEDPNESWVDYLTGGARRRRWEALTPEQRKLLSERETAASNEFLAGARRDAIQTGATAASVPFTGGLGILARLGVAAGAGGAGSLLAETVDPSGSLRGAGLRAAGNAAASAAGEGLGSAVAGVARSVAPGLKRFAEEQAAKAGGFIQSQIKKAGLGGTREYGRELLDAGVVTPLASGETMLARAESGRLAAGKALEQIRAAVDAAPPKVRADVLKGRIAEALYDWRPGSSVEAGYRRQLEQMLRDVDAYADADGRISASGLEGLKRIFKRNAGLADDAVLSPERLRGEFAPRAERARALVQGAEDELTGTARPDLLPSFLGAKQRYGALDTAVGEGLPARIARDKGNNQVFGLSTLLNPGVLALGGAGIGGYSSEDRLGGAVRGAALALAGRQLYLRGNQLSATAANRMYRLASDPRASEAVRSAAQAILRSAAPEPVMLQRAEALP